ncbi:hypothetical protein CCR75_004054 [Bremia lactucae]|uniref:Uncharacterized protein n=1 Tax=Bremia lactucae TaxID=4779 RepID=A0A976FFD3_BRELC|nr:hypothetical protein CCR75_004054 [Bremia lactucae]
MEKEPAAQAHSCIMSQVKASNVESPTKVAGVVSTAEQIQALHMTTNDALLILSSDTGGALRVPVTGVGLDVGESCSTVESNSPLYQDVQVKSFDGEKKKLGRPSHPAWQYFIRGEKRNHFHYNAYCSFCHGNGVKFMAVRGVSGNMIRHLQECKYCPADVVAQLKLVCARKDADNFSKRHLMYTRGDNVVVQETALKKARHCTNRHNELPSRESNFKELGISAAKTNALTSLRNIDNLIPNEAPSLSTETDVELTVASSSSRSLSSESYSFSSPKVNTHADQRLWSTAGKHEHFCNLNLDDAPQESQSLKREIITNEMSRLLFSSTLSASLPWDWAWSEPSASLFGKLHAKVECPSAKLLSTIGNTSHEEQIVKMIDEQVGVSLAVSWWAAKYPRTNFVLLSLINALGEATCWEVFDMGFEDIGPDAFAVTIKRNLSDMLRRKIHVINIVTNTAFAYAASRLAVNSTEGTSIAIPVLPCFTQVLQTLLGVVLTGSTSSAKAIGELIELIQTFSNPSMLYLLRRECGDPSAELHAPTQHQWHSFIEAIDSVQQYKDMIKVISLKFIQATSNLKVLPGRASDKSMFANLSENIVGDVAESGHSGSVLLMVQNAKFWDMIAALSELVSPIKETYKIMSGGHMSSFPLSDICYQFGRMHQQYRDILSDWEDTANGDQFVKQLHYLLRTVNDTWKLYDGSLMVLGYTFNYNLKLQHFARHHSSLQWLSVGMYAKRCFRNWFCEASSIRNPSRLLGLSNEAVAQFMEDILAFKEHKNPFDFESTNDFENPKLFYMLISESHPLMHMFGSRLFSFVTSTPYLGSVLSNMCFIPSAPSTTCPQHTLMPLLKMKLFFQTAQRPLKDMLKFINFNRPMASMTAADLHPQHLNSMSDADVAGAPILHSTGEPEMGTIDRKNGKHIGLKRLK